MFFSIFFSVILPSILSSTIFELEENESNTTVVERTILWRNSYQNIDQTAVFGKGAGRWPIDYLAEGYPKIYRARELQVFFQRPHNEFIRIYFEYGILGLGLFSFILSYVLISAFSLTKSNKTLRIVFSGMAGFIAPVLFSFPFERVEHTVLLFFLSLITLKHQYEIA